MKISFFVAILFMAVLSMPSEGLTDHSAHGDRKNLPKGCEGCHKGHGQRNTPMLPEDKDTFCFRCHGNSANRENMKTYGYLAKDITLNNLDREFQKPYHHPIEKTGIHQYGETLPERDPSVPRHSECGDCHHHHYTTKKNKTVGIRGANVQGIVVQEATAEYELCFKCHSYSANLPSDQKNKAEMFNTSNPSYHPVVAPGKNTDVPSLIRPLTTTNSIKCTDCHNNNDRTGPSGPHGSEYAHILSRHFNPNDGPEQSYEYELCYHCHDRSSILGNRSFFYHNLHITVVGASCRTCHNPHGSMRYAHLIDLDNTSIRPSSSGRMEYTNFAARSGQCFLTCHGQDHNPATYPGTTTTPSKTSSLKSSLRK